MNKRKREEEDSNDESSFLNEEEASTASESRSKKIRIIEPKRPASFKSEMPVPEQYWSINASDVEKSEMDKKIRPTPNRIVISHNFLCLECKKVTPHSYLVIMPDKQKLWQYDLSPYAQAGEAKVEELKDKGIKAKYQFFVRRNTKCLVCKTAWAHHIAWPEDEFDMTKMFKDDAPEKENPQGPNV